MNLNKNRCLCYIVLIFFGLDLLGESALAQTIEINKGLGFPLQVTVKGKVPRGYKFMEVANPSSPYSELSKGLWLGVTAIAGGIEVDFPPRVVKGRFKETFTITTYKVIDITTSGGSLSNVVWVARLWKYKVNSKIHKIRNEEVDIYCRRNGFHMEESYVHESLSN